MNEYILLYVSIILIILYLYLNKSNLKYIESGKTGTKYLVQNNKFKKETAELLEKVIINMYKLKMYLNKNIDKFPNFNKYIKQLDEKLNEERTTIYENKEKSDLTSYSVNKGEEIVFCLKSKKSNKNHKINTIMYVAIHEMAHLGCPEIGHTQLFNKIFKFFLQEAVKLNIYTYTNYSDEPIEYCGMVLTTNILN
jgi:predicted metal-dependent hydrolase